MSGYSFIIPKPRAPGQGNPLPLLYLTSAEDWLHPCGTPIGPHDLLIAAHAKALGAILVTHNTREFERVNGLQIADWES